VYPNGCTAENVPHDLHNAVEHALRVLSWYENLPSDEMPPNWMWCLDWEIERHFERVDAERKAKFGDNSGSAEEEDGQWEDNVYAARFKK
jgi:hypothetical protein